jgi:hypothetical protein
MYCLQVINSSISSELANRLPAFSELVSWYGPYLALVLSLVVAFLVMQYVWFIKLVKAKNKETERLAEREKVLFDRNMYLIDKHIGYKIK